MFASQSLPRLNIRLTAALRAWVAQEAVERKCPMNTVVLDALTMKMEQGLSELLGKKHDAAVKLAISVAQLPKGTGIVLQTDYLKLKTDILVRAPSDADYAVLAHVSGEEVAFSDDPTAAVAEAGA